MYFHGALRTGPAILGLSYLSFSRHGHVGGLLDGMTNKGRSDSRQRHHPVGFEAECDALEDSPFARTIGNASRLALGLPGRVGDMLQVQAASGAALHGSESKRDLHFFKELLPLRLRKTNDQPSEARQ
jgi:hypothetical protein